jgi:hypothetical protein
VTAEEERIDASELNAAWRQTFAAAVIAIVANLAGAILTSVFYGSGFGNTLRYAHATLCAAVLAVLLVRPPTRRLLIGLFATMVVPILPLLVVWTLAIPESQMSESFIAYKMVLMGVAFLTPLSLWLGVGLLAAFAVESLALWALHLAGNLPGEPWVTLFYAVFAIALVAQRAAERRLTRKLVQVNADASALERIARSSLEVRDRMNTPLQTLLLAIELLDEHVAENGARETVARMRRALRRLHELSHKLAEDDRSRRRD